MCKHQQKYRLSRAIASAIDTVVLQNQDSHELEDLLYGLGIDLKWDIEQDFCEEVSIKWFKKFF